MQDYSIILSIALFTSFLIASALAVLFWRRSKKESQNQALTIIQQQVADSAQRQDQQLSRISENLTDSIKNLTTSLNERFTQNQMLAQQTQKSIADRLDSAGKTIADLKGQLGELGQATNHIAKVGSEVKKLQDILQSPKLRGNLGEWSLGNLLADVLPSQHYQLQYSFKSGAKVDALVRLAQGSVSIDAKFPLANFQVMLQAVDDSARHKAKRAFLRDVCQRIDEIAQKYILPDEGTLDFALMYIPAENVYYQAILTDNSPSKSDLPDINAYGRQHKVIPVSPNTLYVYLMVIASGLKGLQIEQNAQLIRQQLGRLNRDLQLFVNDFALLGKHLGNARTKFDDAGKKLDHFEFLLTQIETDAPASLK